MKTSPARNLRQAWLTATLCLCLAALAAAGEKAEPQELPIAHDEYVYMIRFSPDGKTLVTAAGDNVARVWNWSTRELLHTFEHDAAVYAAAFSPDGNLIATGSGDGKVSLRQAATGKLVAERKEHADAIYCLSFSPDGKRLATIGGDGRKGDTQCRIWTVPALDIAKVLPGHDRPAYGVLYGPSTSKPRAIVTSGGDKLIHVYAGTEADLLENRKTLKGHRSDVYRCCFSPNGEQLASTSQDGTLRLWDVATGQQSKTIFKADDPTYDVAYSRDGGILAAVADDGYVRFWNTRSHKLLLELQADKEGLYSVVFTPDQTRVLTGGVSGRVFACPVPKLDAL